MGDPRFRADLYRGTARAYNEFRQRYPQALIDAVATACTADGTGTLLDLACGPGQLGFALSPLFREVWAVDLEPDMIELVREKAAAAGTARVRPVLGAAETLAAPAGYFQLVTIGNAFHRVQRDAVAENAFRWLRPDGWLALVWGGAPDDGSQEWQLALAAFMARWRERLAARAGDRIPAGYEDARGARPDADILRAAGFAPAGTHTFWSAYDWTPDTLAGFLASTAVLSPAALGDLAPEFGRELRAELAPWSVPGGLRQRVRFACELARKP